LESIRSVHSASSWVISSIADVLVREKQKKHAKIVALYQETPEEKHTRLSSENDARIGRIKAEVKVIRAENQLSQKRVEKLERKLASLQAKQTKENH
jgi:hypothetical protein